MSEVEVRRSTRRRRTVSAYRDGDRIVVLVPSTLTAEQERDWVERMVARLERRSRRGSRTDVDLAQRARRLSEEFLGGQAEPTSVRWVPPMRTRWGSCTPLDGTIRLSSRLQGMPAYVVDYVLLHELAHLLVPGHGRAFWRLLAAYPDLARAKAFLDGAAFAQGWERDPDTMDGEDATNDPDAAHDA